MHPNFTLDYFPAEYFARSVADRGATGLFSRMLSRGHANTVRKESDSVRSEGVSFTTLVNDTEARMRVHCNESDCISAEYRRRESLHGKIELSAFQWAIGPVSRPIASLRMVYIHGPKNQIINTWVFPNRPQSMPVFAAELIAVGAEIRVAFVDIQVPVIESTSVLDDTSLLTAGLVPRFSGLPCGEAPPIWAIESSQGNYTYARNVTRELVPVVEDCYRAYLDAYLEAFTPADVAIAFATSLRDEESIGKLHEYQCHHMVSSPGNKFLSKLFGSEWTESFMREFLFAVPRG